VTELRPAPNGYPIKLVRDNTPRIINGSGEPGELFYGEIPDDRDRQRWLKKKLAEEVAEYLLEGGLEELIDIYAVVESLAQWHGIRDLRRIAHNDPRGLFDSGMMMYGRHPEFDKEGAA